MQKTIILFAMILIFASGFVKSGIDIEEIKARYAKYNAVITNLEFNYLIDVKHDSLMIQQTNIKEMLIINDHSIGFTNDDIFYRGFTSISDKKAYTLIPTGKKYNKIPVTKFKETHERDGNVFYDDSKTIQFSYPSLQQNALTFLKYTINYSNPRFIRKAYLQSYIPIIKSKIVVKIHKDVKVDYKLFNYDSTKINFKQYSKRKYYYLEWEANNMEPFKYSIGSNYSISYHSPHVVLYIDETNINGIKRNYFGTVDDLYNFYDDFVSDVSNNYSEELNFLVNRITYGLSDQEKAKTIYYWVQNNIKYIAYEQGYMGFVPCSASEVFKKRFGDCKGMSSLIKGMMEIAGLPAYYTWVGTRSIPYTYEDLPLPSVDNHMIVTYLQNDSVFVLDGTYKYLDYGTYPYYIQDKEILIGLTSDDYEIFKIPISQASFSVVTDSVNISLSNNSIIGEAKRIHKGYNKAELAYAMDGVKETDYNKKFTKLFNKGSNKFKVEDHQAYNLFERDIPAVVHYDFILNDYCRKLNDDIYVNINLDKSYQELLIDTTKVMFTPIENDFHFTEKFICRFEIPDGYEVAFIPDNGYFEDNNFRFSIYYSQVKNYIILEKEIVFEFLILLEDQIEQWNQMINQLNKHYRSSLVLKKQMR